MKRTPMAVLQELTKPTMQGMVINNRAKRPSKAPGKKKVIVQESEEDHECCGEVTPDSCLCSLATCCGPKHPGH